jgi:hypothetical protein
MEFLERHPLLVRGFLRPLSRVPVFSRRLKVLPRAFKGNTAFDIHDAPYRQACSR